MFSGRSRDLWTPLEGASCRIKPKSVKHYCSLYCELVARYLSAKTSSNWCRASPLTTIWLSHWWLTHSSTSSSVVAVAEASAARKTCCRWWRPQQDPSLPCISTATWLSIQTATPLLQVSAYGLVCICLCFLRGCLEASWKNGCPTGSYLRMWHGDRPHFFHFAVLVDHSNNPYTSLQQHRKVTYTDRCHVNYEIHWLALLTADWLHALVCADAPGMTSDDIHVELHEGTLKVSGEKSRQHEEGKPGHKVWRQERSFQKFQRCFALPEDANPETINARLEHGVLTVEVSGQTLLCCSFLHKEGLWSYLQKKHVTRLMVRKRTCISRMDHTMIKTMTALTVSIYKTVQRTALGTICSWFILPITYSNYSMALKITTDCMAMHNSHCLSAGRVVLPYCLSAKLVLEIRQL